MTPAGQRWTRNKPTEPGWYWHKSGTVVTLVRLIQRNGALLLWVPDNEPRSSAATFDPYPGVEWLGPLTPDSYQQGRVAGLREASRKASDAVPLLLGTHPNFANYIADALMDFSDILNEDADKLAQ